MNIIDIKDSKFLKKYKIKDLENLSQEIRNFIIEKVSITGGHLSSNLGIVDLTVAIHKTFDFKKDKIIFDVGHQSYTHKILTGRVTQFDNLRKLNGLSGFQSMKESEYDHYEAGHSSTSLSAALGFAIARDLNKQKFNVIAVIGDGSICNGLAYEALNHIGELKSKIIIILNDNEMSISKNIGAIKNLLDKLRSNKSYNKAKSSTKSILSKIPFIGEKIENEIKNFKKGIKKIYLKEGYFFEEFGLKYYGPINGHDYVEMLNYLEIAKNENEPVLLHVITKKGKGYKFAEEDDDGKWHGVSNFNTHTGEFIKKQEEKISWSEVICKHLIKLAKTNKDLIVITPAMAKGSHLLEFKNKFPKRFIDVGIAEEHSLVLANALAISKKKPFVSIYSTFLQRGYDQIIHDIAKINKNVIIGIDRCGIVGEDGPTHQGIYDISFMMSIPNIIIMSPKDSIEAGNMLYSAFNFTGPVAIRYSRNNIEFKKTNYKTIKIGSWEIIKNGENATIISYGDFLEKAINISKKLEKSNINLKVVNARFIKPIDNKLFKELLKENKPIFVYEEVTKINSLGNYLSAISQENNFKNKTHIIAIEDKFIEQGKKEEVIKLLKLDETSVYNYIKKELNN